MWCPDNFLVEVTARSTQKAFVLFLTATKGESEVQSVQFFAISNISLEAT